MITFSLKSFLILLISSVTLIWSVCFCESFSRGRHMSSPLFIQDKHVGFLTCNCVEVCFMSASVLPAGLSRHGDWGAAMWRLSKNLAPFQEQIERLPEIKDGASHLHFNALVQLLAGCRYGLCGAELKVPELVLHSRNEREQKVRKLPVFSLWIMWWRRGHSSLCLQLRKLSGFTLGSWGPPPPSLTRGAKVAEGTVSHHASSEGMLQMFPREEPPWWNCGLSIHGCIGGWGWGSSLFLSCSNRGFLHERTERLHCVEPGWDFWLSRSFSFYSALRVLLTPPLMCWWGRWGHIHQTKQWRSPAASLRVERQQSSSG